MAKQIDKSCETCRFWLPMGGCEYGGDMLCNEWKLSLSYEQNQELTLWD